jgi:outer membrane protein insertion porin family
MEMQRQSGMRFLRACAVAAVVVSPISVSAFFDQAHVQPASSLAVEGNRRIEAATVRSYFQAAADGTLDAGALDAGLKSLLATGLFERAEIDRTGARIVVRVVEAPLLGRVVFEGNKKIQDKELTAAVESKTGGTLQRSRVQADVGRSRDIYRRSGRDDARVVPLTVSHGTGRLDLVFEITEGSKTAVKAISFAGNHAFGPRQLKAVIRTGESNLLSFVLRDDIYDTDQIEADRELLRRFYLGKGFADVSVPAAKAEYDDDKKGFTLHFTIDEGPVYRFGKAEVVCNVPGVESSDLQRLLVARERQAGAPGDWS